MNVNKDFFYKELHEPHNQATLRAFAVDKKMRTLVVARVDKSLPKGDEEVKADGEPTVVVKTNGGEEQANDAIQETDYSQIEILFSLKVQYLGQLAHSIAFVKREAHT